MIPVKTDTFVKSTGLKISIFSENSFWMLLNRLVSTVLQSTISSMHKCKQHRLFMWPAAARLALVLVKTRYNSSDLHKWVDSEWHIRTIRLHSAIHVGSRWKIQDKRQIKNTDNTLTKHYPDKSNNTKYSKTKLPWFSHFLRQSARKWGGIALSRTPAEAARPRIQGQCIAWYARLLLTAFTGTH